MDTPAKHQRPVIEEVAARMEDLASLQGDPRQGISSCFALLVELTKAERGFMLLVSEGEPGLIPYAGCNVDLENILVNEEVSQTIIQAVVEKQKPLLTTNAMQDPRFADRISVLIAGLRSVICAPLSTDRGFFGLLYLDNRSETAFFKNRDRDYLTECAGKLSEIMEKRCPGLVYRPPVSGTASPGDLADPDNPGPPPGSPSNSPDEKPPAPSAGP